jgi:hypothetical protein
MTLSAVVADLSAYTALTVTINTFTASTASVSNGQSARFTWSTTNAVSVAITTDAAGLAVPVSPATSGNALVGPFSSTTTVTLTATDDSGNTTARFITITVSPNMTTTAYGSSTHGASDGEFGNPLNWFTDSGFSTPFGSFPGPNAILITDASFTSWTLNIGAYVSGTNPMPVQGIDNTMGGTILTGADAFDYGLLIPNATGRFYLGNGVQYALNLDATHGADPSNPNVMDGGGTSGDVPPYSDSTSPTMTANVGGGAVLVLHNGAAMEGNVLPGGYVRVLTGSIAGNGSPTSLIQGGKLSMDLVSLQQYYAAQTNVAAYEAQATLQPVTGALGFEMSGGAGLPVGPVWMAGAGSAPAPTAVVSPAQTMDSNGDFVDGMAAGGGSTPVQGSVVTFARN